MVPSEFIFSRMVGLELMVEMIDGFNCVSCFCTILGKVGRSGDGMIAIWEFCMEGFQFRLMV